MKLLHQIDHPSVIKVYEMFECNRFICLVTELMEGGELFNLIVQKNFFSEDESRQIIRSLISAI
jgi:serine/threonine protein kinase